MNKHKEIKKFWNNQAREWKDSPNVSWKDTVMIEKEIRGVSQWIKPGQLVLDAGCANGWTTNNIKKRNPTCTFRGMDFSEEMVKRARAVYKDIDFWVQNISNFREKSKYDFVYSIRVLINLPTEKEQLKALDNLWNAVRPGGLLVISEATKEGWEETNALRKKHGLSELPMPWHNFYLDYKKIFKHMKPKCSKITMKTYASSYYWLTRFLRPYLFGEFKQVTFNTWFHKLAGKVPNFGEWGTQKAMIFEKPL